MHLIFLIMTFMSFSFAEKPNKEILVYGRRPIIIYVDSNGENIENLKTLLPTYAITHKHMIRKRISSFFVTPFNGYIKVYHKDNIHLINHNKCDYNKDARKCSIENSHWYLKANLFVEDLRASLLMQMYDENGMEISSSSVPLYGYIELIPQYKKTTIKENSIFGPSQREILEQYPPKRLKHQPKVDGKQVSQAIMRLYLGIDQQYINELNLDKK